MSVSAPRSRLLLVVLALFVAGMSAMGWLLHAERAATPAVLRALAETLSAAAERSQAAPALDALPAGWLAMITDARGNAVASHGSGTGTMLRHDARSPGGWHATVAAPRPPALGWIAAPALLALLAAAAIWRMAEQRRRADADRRDAARQHAQAQADSRAADAEAQLQRLQLHLLRCQRHETLGRLVGVALHEINNVLGVVANSAQLLQRRPPSAADELPLAALERAVTKGSDLTRSLAAFANRRPGPVRPFDLERRLPDLAHLTRMVLGKGVALTINVAPGTPCIAADETEVELLLINIALNARAALPPAGGRVWIDAHPADAADGGDAFVQLSVSDDGAGIGDDVAQRAFEPFFSTRDGASGLGLAQVQAFCQRGGGSARIAGTPGLGATVSLLLPAVAPDGSAPGQTVAGDTLADRRLQGRKVLLVDDNQELAHITALLLSAYGCDVDSATSAAEALAKVDAGTRFDVVLSDVVMPGELDGVALAKRLRQRVPSLPVVLISGYSSALASLPGFVVLQKPCSPQQLLDALAHALESG